MEVEFRSWLTPCPASDCATPRNAGREFTSRANLPRSRWNNAPDSSSPCRAKETPSIAVFHRSLPRTMVVISGRRTAGNQGTPALADAS